jgi:hypothetical protein
MMNYGVWTQAGALRQLAERWKKQYFSDRKGWYSDRSLEIYEALFREDQAGEINAEKINSIMGSDSWITILCDVCAESTNKPAVIIDTGDESTVICVECLKKMMEDLQERLK